MRTATCGLGIRQRSSPSSSGTSTVFLCCQGAFNLAVPAETPHDLSAGSALGSSRCDNEAGMGCFSKERELQWLHRGGVPLLCFPSIHPSVYAHLSLCPLTIRPSSVHWPFIHPSMPIHPSVHLSIDHLSTDHPPTIHPSTDRPSVHQLCVYPSMPLCPSIRLSTKSSSTGPFPAQKA